MKIAARFVIGAIIMAILSAFMYVRFINDKQGIETLVTSGKIRGESLQLTIHEKNYFLYPHTRKAEADVIHKIP